MDSVTTDRFELVLDSPRQMHGVFTRVVNLLTSATQELEHSKEAAMTSIRRATCLLQTQMRYEGMERGDASLSLLAWQVGRVEQYIDSHLNEQILVGTLSALVKLSEAHFSRAFRLALGEPPHAYIIRRRVEKAAQLMLTGSAPLSQIAAECGFSDQAHLSKQFRQLIGATPAAWRRQHRIAVVDPRSDHVS